MLCLPLPRPSEEEQVNEIVHNLWNAYQTYKRQHTKESILRVVKLAQDLQVWGYVMLLDPHKNMVGAASVRKLANKN
jgi:hypothetical protein